MYSLLLVDDEPLALAGLQSIIPWEEYGFTVRDACVWPDDALELAKKHHPDVLITDLRMPEMDGMTLYQAICQEGWKPELVIVSAYSDFDVARTAIEYEAAAYILKPLNREEVARVASRLAARLSQRQKQDPATEILPADDPPQLDLRLKSMHLPPVWRLLCVEKEAPPELKGEGRWIPLESKEFPRLYLLALPSLAIPRELLWNKWVYVPAEDIKKEPGQIPADHLEGQLSPAGESSVLLPAATGVLTPPSEDESTETLLAEIRAAVSGSFRYSSNAQAAMLQFYIGTHYAEPLSLNSISAHFYLSGTYLSNFFKKNTGVNLIAFLNHVRIHQAVHLMTRGSLRLKETAVAVGYHDYGHFNRQFRRIMGCSPEQWTE